MVDFLLTELEAMKKEYNEVASELIHATDHKIRVSGWQKIRDAYRLRIARVEKLLEELR